MKFTLIVFFISFVVAAEELKYPYEAFLDLEDSEPAIQAFTHKGLHWSTCEKVVDDDGIERCVDSVGFLHKNAKIKVLGPSQADFYVDRNGKTVIEEYSEVEFEYVNKIGQKITGKGFIIAGRLRPVKEKKTIQSIYSKSEEKVCKASCPGAGEVIPPKVEHQIAKAKDKFFDEYLEKINKLTDEAHRVVGQCVKESGKAGIVYDEIVMPKLPNGSANLTRDQLISIDSLARTLYGEVQGCYKYGLHYPLAVARVILNRSELADKSKAREEQFIKGEHAKQKSSLSKIVTSPTQFNVWMRDKNLSHALCPPATKERFWKAAARPSAEDLAIWKNSVRIAVEAIKFPDSFKARTGGDSFSYLFYTSNVGKFYNMKQEFPQILGRQFDSKCLEFWREQPVEPKKKEEKTSKNKKSSKKKKT